MSHSGLTDDDILSEARLSMDAHHARHVEEAADAAQQTENTGISQVVEPIIGPRIRYHDDREQRIVSGRLWLISFTDLFSILLCFFLLIFSTREIDLTKIETLSSKAKKGEKIEAQVSAGNGLEKAKNIDRVEYGDAINLDYLHGVLDKSIAQVKLQDDVRISEGKNYLVLTVDSEKLFAGAVLSASGQRIIDGLAERLMRLSNHITVAYSGGDSLGDSLALAALFSKTLKSEGYRKDFTTLAEDAGGAARIEIRLDPDTGLAR